MKFPETAYAMAPAAGFAASYLSLPLWRAWCVRAGLVDDPGHRKIHATTVPLAGGLAVATGILLPLLAGLLALKLRWLDDRAMALLSHGFARRQGELTSILAGAAGMLFLGIWDDRVELKPAAKFIGQIAIAFMVAASGARITLFVDSRVFSYAVTVFWILAVTNAFNFMDNMNGLCAGLGLLGAFFFGLFASGAGQYLAALLAFLAVGALAGFLPYNFPKARSFLGDGGSHLVGYLMAILAIVPHFYTARRPHVLAVFTPLLVLAVPLGDLAWVVVLRWRLGRPFYVGDNNHLSHRLTRRGFSRERAVVLIWLAATVAGALALWLGAW
jgi:UDP-GlcNAc:undecaprenyl-phosphate GlcNAc-1-phosphate transferase